MKIIILGFGHICKTHYLKWCAYNPSIDKIYIYDSFINKRNIENYLSTYKLYDDLLSKFVILESSINIKNIFYSNTFEKVFILTNNTSHFHLAMLALENNSDVLVEKPVTLTSKGLKLLEKKAKLKNQILFPAYHQLHRSETYLFIDSIKEFLILNNNYEVNIFAGNNKGFPIHSMKNGFSKIENAGGGVLLDLGSHYISLLFFFLYESGLKELEFLDINTNFHPRDNIFFENVEDSFIASFRNKNLNVNIDFSYKKELPNTLIFKNEKNHLIWPGENLIFSNLAFKNMISSFIDSKGKDFQAKLLKSNYYKSIEKSIDLIERLYKTAGHNLKEKFFNS